MSISLTWCARGKGVYWLCTGEISYTDIQQADAQQYSDQRFQNAIYVFIDLMATERVLLSELEVTMDVTHDSIHSYNNENLNVIFVADKPEFQAIGHMYAEQFALKYMNWDVQVFSTIQEAKLWLCDKSDDIELADLQYI